MKFSFVFLTGLMASAFALGNDLKTGASADSSYTALSVQTLNSGAVSFKYNKATSTSMATYQGAVTLNLKVEGNICDFDPKSLGVLKLRDGQRTVIRVVVGKPNHQNTMCPQYSKATDIMVPLNFLIFEAAPNKVQAQSVGFITSWDPLSGKIKDSEIVLESLSGQMSLVIK